MLSPTLLVTLRGPLKTLDLELPGDVPVSELLPLFLEICGSHQNDPPISLQASVSLQVAGMSAPLQSDKTLMDGGVRDGTVLVLQTNHLPSTAAESPGPQPFIPKTVRPDANTRGIGVTWETLG
jgi:hypothetical protein